MSKYVVIMEIPSNGYMDCIGIFDTIEQAFGQAYLDLCDGLDQNNYYITLYEDREGENGWCFSVINRDTHEEELSATVLHYEEEDDDTRDL